MTERAQCSVAGCKATTGRFASWICSRHWSRLTRDERRLWARIRRIARRYGWEAVDDRARVVWSALARRAYVPTVVHFIAPADRRTMRATRCGQPTNRNPLSVDDDPAAVTCRMCRRCIDIDAGLRLTR